MNWIFLNNDVPLFQALASLPTKAPNQTRPRSGRGSNPRPPSFPDTISRPPQRRSSSWPGARWSNWERSWKSGKPRGEWGERPGEHL